MNFLQNIQANIKQLAAELKAANMQSLFSGKDIIHKPEERHYTVEPNEATLYYQSLEKRCEVSGKVIAEEDN